MRRIGSCTDGTDSSISSGIIHGWCCTSAVALHINGATVDLRAALPVRLQQGPSWRDIAVYEEDMQLQQTGNNTRQFEPAVE
jgi:hypothetical protein